MSLKAEECIIGELLSPPQFKKLQLCLANVDVPDRMQVLYNMLLLMKLNTTENENE